MHWLLLIHANWTTELEIRLNDDIPEAVREKDLTKLFKNGCEGVQFLVNLLFLLPF